MVILVRLFLKVDSNLGISKEPGWMFKSLRNIQGPCSLDAHRVAKPFIFPNPEILSGDEAIYEEYVRRPCIQCM